jgi:hypothetical protein
MQVFCHVTLFSIRVVPDVSKDCSAFILLAGESQDFCLSSLISVEYCWNVTDGENPKYFEEKPVQYHSVHQNSNTD